MKTSLMFYRMKIRIWPVVVLFGKLCLWSGILAAADLPAPPPFVYDGNSSPVWRVQEKDFPLSNSLRAVGGDKMTEMDMITRYMFSSTSRKKTSSGNVFVKLNIPDPERKNLSIRADGKDTPYVVGETIKCSLQIGPTNSALGISSKDLLSTTHICADIFIMDENQPTQTNRIVRFCLGMANCGGGFCAQLVGSPLIPTGTHYMTIRMDDSRYGINDSTVIPATVSFRFKNDWPIDTTKQLAASYKSQNPSDTIMVFQQGIPVPEMGISSYLGVSDTGMISPVTPIDRDQSSSSFGKAPNLTISLQPPESRSLMKFDLSGILPSQASAIKGGRLVFWELGSTHINQPIAFELYGVKKPWTAGGGGGLYKSPTILNGEASWQAQSYPTLWETWGCDGASDRESALIATSPLIVYANSNGVGRVEIDIPAARIQQWIQNPSQNYGFLIKPSANSDIHSFADIASSENGNFSLRPALLLDVDSATFPESSTSPDYVTLMNNDPYYAPWKSMRTSCDPTASFDDTYFINAFRRGYVPANANTNLTTFILQ